jgi:hypothetical protein
MMICASQETPSWNRLRLPGDEPGQIDGEEAGATEGAARREDEQGQGQHEDRQQAVIQIETADKPHDCNAPEQADDGSEAHVHQEAGDQVENQDLRCRIGAGGDDLDQRDGQKDGDRIVGA